MRTSSQQRAALTRAIKTKDHAKVLAEVTRTVQEWRDGTWHNGRPGQRAPVRPNVWPDGWARWQRALDDVTPGWGPADDIATL
jgi:hypothetical protein